jgi:hypothetical protein
MDADDVAYPGRLREQVDFLTRIPEIGLAGSGVDLIWGGSGAHFSPEWHDHIVDTYLINNPFYHPTVMFRRKLFDDGIFWYDPDQSCDEDYELWGRIITQTKVANIRRSLIQYRIHGQNAQWDPRKHGAKTRALTGFCARVGLDDPGLVDALVEFQCSGFVRRGCYAVMKRHADRADAEGLPKLGWIHDALRREPGYAAFVAWHRRAVNWAT